MCDKQTLALWITGLLVVAQHHTAYSAHQQPPKQFSGLVGSLATNTMPSVRAYREFSNYNATLPLPLLRNGIVYAGDNGRLRHVVKKLLHGEPTSLGVIGGSVSYGYGVRRGISDWFSMFTSYLRSAFPKASITARNGCVPAAQSEYISMCLEKFVNRDADLIFVEFATSDGYLDTSVDNPYVRAFERLIRKILKLPNRPAIVLLNYLAKNAINPNSLFYHTVEDHYGILAQYYQLPWLSVRDAVWFGLQHNWEGLSFQDMFLSSGVHPWLPNELGHKYIADLAVGLIQQTYLELMLLPLSTADLSFQDNIPVPMFSNNHESQNTACAIGLDLKALATSANKNWHFVNEGSVLKPRWGFVSYVPNATLVLTLDTREISAQHTPQLATHQKAQIMQHHGMFAAAAAASSAAGPQRQGTETGLTDVGFSAALVAPAAAGGRAEDANPAFAPSAAATSDGLQAALQESRRQAEAAAQMMQSGQLPAYVGRERIVGGQRSGFQTPPDAREVASSTTSTGVEVIVNNGRKLFTGAASGNASKNDAEADEMLGSSSSNDGSSSSHLPDAASGSSSDRYAEGSRDYTGAIGARTLLRASNPKAVPPPRDAVHLKPAGSVLSAFVGQPNSLAHADMSVWIGYQKSHWKMGKARLYCISGCVCHEITLDAWHSEKTSRLAMAKLLVTQHEQCEIGVQVLGQTRSGQTKFKVTGVMVSKMVEYRSADVHADSALLGALEAAGHVATGS